MGTEVLMKKEDRDEYYFTPTKGKKGKSKAKASKAEGSSKPIKHNAETFRLFDQLKLNAPITTDEVPALIEELEKQYESYKAKVKDWKTRMISPRNRRRRRRKRKKRRRRRRKRRRMKRRRKRRKTRRRKRRMRRKKLM